VIEARGVKKTFRIPERRMDSLKERATHPFTRIEYRELHALRDVSFEVHKGEFFGIAGKNGSGKSTLLKILASIYRADAGRVRMAGRVAPFIELGVGFNTDLTARENVVLNGVLMGLDTREARKRLDAVLDFAELRDFVEVELKNYSSGMMVRLAFAVMVQADADVMLIDEVLAVGDEAFAQKCMDVFHERRAAGKTVVLVTHDMGTMETLCDRAMLLHEGNLEYVGDTRETALRYHQRNFNESTGEVGDRNATLVSAEVATVEQGEELALDVMLEATEELVEPRVAFHIVSDSGVTVTRFSPEIEGPVVQGRRLEFRGRVENRLVPGRYYLDCWVRRRREDGWVGVQGIRLASFTVEGDTSMEGVVSLHAEVEAVWERQRS
jgi:ABC-2 type transport system ATP-binding protein